jgi:hypothetical protein
VDAKPPKGFDDAPVSYDCDAAWAWASGYESGWNERAAIAQSAAAAKATAEDEAIYKSIADNYFKAEPAEAGCAACGTGDSASSIIDTPQPWTQEHLKAYPKAALDILNKRGRQD